MRRSTKWLFAAGLVAFLLIVVTQIPASMAAHWLPANLQVGSLGGTLWHGEALGVHAQAFDIERVEWRLRPLSLFAGRFSASIAATNGADLITGEVTVDRSGRIEAHDVEAKIDVASLAGRTLPSGWGGPATLHLEELTIAGGWIASIVGTAESGTLTGPPHDQPYLGSYRVTFGKEASRAPGEILGNFRDTGGPIEISGEVRLYQDRRAVISGWVRARASAPPGVIADIASLPEVDPQGRRRFSVENTF